MPGLKRPRLPRMTNTMHPMTVETHDADTAALPMVATTNLTKTYGSGPGAFTSLHEVSMTIPRGRFVALLGRSGSGKSTLLNLLGAVDRPTAGSIRVAGTDLTQLSDAELALFRRRRLGFVFQSFQAILPGWHSIRQIN